MARELATGYVSLAVSAEDVGRDLTAAFKSLPNTLGKIGRSSGTAMAAEFDRSTKGMAGSVERESKAAADAVEGAANRQAKALKTYQASLSDVRIAEAKLEEVQSRKNAKASQLLTAQANLAKANDRVADSGKALQRATADADAAQERLKKSTDSAGSAAEKHAGSFKRFGAAIRNVDTDKLRGGLDQVGRGMATVAGAAARAGGAIAAGLAGGVAATVTMAGRAEQSVGGVESVFGSTAASIIEDSKRAADAYGLSAVQYQELATTMGASLKNKGITDYAEQTKRMVGLGGDLAATFGGSAAEAVEALNAAMRGEADPIERYGVSLSETAVNAELARRGQQNLTGSALETAKAQARLSLIMQQTSSAQGQANREHDTFAATLERVKAQAANLGAELGVTLLPYAQQLMSKISENIPAIQEWADTFTTFIVDKSPQIKAGFDQLVEAVRTVYDRLVQFGQWIADHQNLMGALAIGIGVAVVAVYAMTAALWLMSLTPVSLIIGGIVVAIALLAAGIAYLAIRWDTIWAGIKTAAQVVGDWFAGPFAGFFTATWAAITGAFTAAKDWIVGVFTGLWGWVSGVFMGWWNGIVSLFSVPLDNARNVVQVFAEAIRLAFQWVWDRIVEIWTGISNWLAPFIDGIRAWITEKFNAIRDGIVAAIGWARDRLSEIWQNVSDRVHGVIDPMATWLSDKFTWISTSAGNIFEGMRSKVVDLFERMQAGIKTAWDKIKGVFSAPVRWVADIVVNPLIRGFNTLADKVGMPQNKLDEWKFNGFAGGGYTGPGGKYQPAGIVHAGEIVWSQDDIRQHGGISRVEALRTGGGAGYASGGVVQPVSGAGKRHSGYPWATWAGDFPQPAGTPVHAWKDGVVALVKSLTTSYGKHVRINHDDGTSSLYAHLSKILVAASQRVSAGQVIGNVGSTGNSTGPHLHFETKGGPFTGGTSDGGFDLLGAITGFASGPMARLKELGDSGFGGLVKSLPGKILEGMKAKALSAWNGLADTVKAGGNFALASGMAAGRGWGPGNIASLLWLIQKESGGRVDATNPSSGAYGIPQALPGSKMASAGADWRTNPRTQISWMMGYIEDRYGDATAAKRFHQAHNWYDEGGILPAGITVAHNDTGRPEAILTEPQWQVVEAAALNGGGRVQVDLVWDDPRARSFVRAEVRQMAREGEIVRAA